MKWHRPSLHWEKFHLAAITSSSIQTNETESAERLNDDCQPLRRGIFCISVILPDARYQSTANTASGYRILQPGYRIDIRRLYPQHYVTGRTTFSRYEWDNMTRLLASALLRDNRITWDFHHTVMAESNILIFQLPVRGYCMPKISTTIYQQQIINKIQKYLHQSLYQI